MITSLEESPERWRLAHKDRSELSLHQTLTQMATQVSQQPIAYPTMMATPRRVS